MKKYLYSIALVFALPLLSIAQAEYTSISDNYPIHDLESKVDFQLVEKEGAKFLKVKINTHLNLGCIDTSEVILIYLDNGNDVDFTPTEKNCGALAENKKHSDYTIYYSVPAEDLESLRTHKMEYFEIESQNQTLVRKASQFQSLSKDKFENYFIKSLSE